MTVISDFQSHFMIDGLQFDIDRLTMGMAMNVHETFLEDM